MKIYFSPSKGELSDKMASYLKFKLNNKNVFIEKPVPNPLAVDEIMTNKRALVKADAVIFDISNGWDNEGLGYLLTTAMTERKKVLIVKEKGKDTPPPIGTLAHKVYQDLESMTKIVDKFLDWVQSELDTKFILILPSEIDSYLVWASETRRQYKAQVVRDAIESIMWKDRDYKQYLKNAQT